jgi:hypothetical protein
MSQDHDPTTAKLEDIRTELARARSELEACAMQRDRALRLGVEMTSATSDDETSPIDVALAQCLGHLFTDPVQLELTVLRELVRAAQHHIPRRWPQWPQWANHALRVLGEPFAHSGSSEYNPVLDFEAEPGPDDLGYIRCMVEDDGNYALWWRPQRRGYTSDLTKAGLYTREEAEQYTSRDAFVRQLDVIGHTRTVVALPLAQL